MHQFNLNWVQNSKFLQFMSKVSRGDVVLEENVVKEVKQGQADQWGEEFDQLHGRSAADHEKWASEFAAKQANPNATSSGLP